MTPEDRLIATARSQIGYLEKASNSQLDDKTANAGQANYTKYARDLDAAGMYYSPKNGYAWCDMFVDWCMMTTFGLDTALCLTGQKLHGYGAGCTESASYYKNIGRLYSEPKPGDQFFATNDGCLTFFHTGIVEKYENGVLYTIEGNTWSSSGIIPNGGCVAAKKYILASSSIKRFGRPRYEFAKEEEVQLPEFKKLYSQMRQELQDNDNNDYSEEARQWAVANQIIKGGNNLPDGSPNYMWEDVLTREQMITLMFRFAKYIGKL